MKKIVGLILTGGENRRMKGRIKLFLPWHGSDFLNEIRNALRDLPELFLSVRDPESYLDQGLPMVVDEGEAIGPLGGILAAFHQTDADALLVVASDMPEIDRRVVEQLLAAWRERSVSTLFRDADYKHPFPGIYGREALPVMERLASEGRYHVQGFLQEVPHQLLWVRGDELFLENVNTKEEYDALYRRTEEEFG